MTWKPCKAWSVQEGLLSNWYVFLLDCPEILPVFPKDKEQNMQCDFSNFDWMFSEKPSLSKEYNSLYHTNSSNQDFIRAVNKKLTESGTLTCPLFAFSESSLNHGLKIRVKDRSQRKLLVFFYVCVCPSRAVNTTSERSWPKYPRP